MWYASDRCRVVGSQPFEFCFSILVGAVHNDAWLMPTTCVRIFPGAHAHPELVDRNCFYPSALISHMSNINPREQRDTLNSSTGAPRLHHTTNKVDFRPSIGDRYDWIRTFENPLICNGFRNKKNPRTSRGSEWS